LVSYVDRLSLSGRDEHVTAPSGEQIAAAIDALRMDAGEWVEMADQMEAAANAAAGLGLGTFHFSGLGHLLGIDEIYQDLQETIITLLKQGSVNLDNVAAALKTAADSYEQEDQDAVHRLRNIY
jgi:hypothetical protein